MRKKIFLCIILLVTISACIFSEDNETDKKPPSINTKNEAVFRRNKSGDWFLRLNVNVAPPLLPQQLKFGMDLDLGAYFFVANFFAVGAQVGFSYNPTIGQKVFYSIPILAEAVFQLELGNFEIPIFLGIGGAFEHHANNFLFGFVFKPEIGFFYRINSDWSVGATFGASIMPQWYQNPAYNYTGYILDTGISARYHM